MKRLLLQLQDVSVQNEQDRLSIRRLVCNVEADLKTKVTTEIQKSISGYTTKTNNLYIISEKRR